MAHVIEFVTDWLADLEKSPGQPLERLLLRSGTRRRARLRARILPGRWGPVEAADLSFEDGTTALGVPYAAFTFID
jgi:hypothetical protein